MSKKMKSMRLSDRTIGLIESFPISTIEPDFTWKLEEMVDNMAAMLKYTTRELVGLFTESEANLICDSLNGFMYTYQASPKSCLLSNISDSITLDKLDKKWNVAGEKLLEKLQGLTEFQAYTVLTFVFKFWTDALENNTLSVKNYFPGIE